MTGTGPAGVEAVIVPAPAGNRRRLAGFTLTAARLGWLVPATMAVGLMLFGLRPEYGRLETICAAQSSCAEPHLTPATLHQLNAIGLSTGHFAAFFLIVELSLSLVYAGIGALIFWRRSDEPLALLSALFLVTFGPSVAIFDAVPLGWPALAPATVLIKAVSITALIIFLFVFPQGRFVPRWTLAGALAVAAIALPDTLAPVWPLPFVLPRAVKALAAAAALGGLVAVQVHRYRRVSDAAERQQTKWVVLGASATLLGFLALLVPIALGGKLESLTAVVGGDLAYFLVLLPLPVSIGLAVARRGLWDVDLVINRALVYGSLTAGLALVFMVVVVGAGQLLRAEGNLGLSVAATALVAILCLPLRDLLQRAVNRLMYGRRDEPFAVLSSLGRQLEATMPAERVLRSIVDTIAQTLKLPYAAIALEQDGELVRAAEAGAPSRGLLRIVLTHQGLTLGELLLAPRSGEAELSPADRRLLHDLAGHVGVAVYATRLTLEVQRSRERLVTAREEERRRLRRDLHDGLGPALASLALMADAAGNLLERDPQRAARLLAEVKAEAKAATAEVRRVVYELRPPTLDELGLVAALREHASQCGEGGVRVSVAAAEPLPPLPAAVEVAAYRIVQEALTNVVRHAGARTCQVEVAADRMLRLEVRDDGRGMNGARPGVGLQSMRERAEELGGTWLVESAASGGTVVRASLPLGDD